LTLFKQLSCRWLFSIVCLTNARWRNLFPNRFVAESKKTAFNRDIHVFREPLDDLVDLDNDKPPLKVR